MNDLRFYPPDSPEAAARIVALALICDGQVQRTELDALEALRAPERLGLTPEALRGVVHELCADILARAAERGEAACHIDLETIEQLLGDVTKPRLRRRVLQLVTAVIGADREVHEGESIVVLTAMEHWGFPPQALIALGEPVVLSNTGPAGPEDEAHSWTR